MVGGGGGGGGGNFTKINLHLFQSNWFCVWFSLYNCPRRVILCLPWTMWRCLFMWSLNVLNFSDYVSTQGNQTMPLHVCIKCVSFEEYKVALVATKLFFCFICLALFIQLHHESNSVFRQDKEMLSLHVSIQLKICLIWRIWNCNCTSPANGWFVWRSLG